MNHTLAPGGMEMKCDPGGLAAAEDAAIGLAVEMGGYCRGWR